MKIGVIADKLVAMEYGKDNYVKFLQEEFNLANNFTFPEDAEDDGWFDLDSPFDVTPSAGHLVSTTFKVNWKNQPGLTLHSLMTMYCGWHNLKKRTFRQAMGCGILNVDDKTIALFDFIKVTENPKKKTVRFKEEREESNIGLQE